MHSESKGGEYSAASGAVEEGAAEMHMVHEEKPPVREEESPPPPSWNGSVPSSVVEDGASELVDKEAGSSTSLTEKHSNEYLERKTLKMRNGQSLTRHAAPDCVNKPINPVQRLLTIRCDHPELVAREDVLAAVKKFQLSPDQRVTWEGFAEPQAIVFLFTPSFATMLQNDASLVGDIVQTMNQQVSPKRAKALYTHIVVACVDGISPPPEMISCARDRISQEGFSVLHGPLADTLSPLWASDAHRLLSDSPTSPSIQSSITFRPDPDDLPQVTLPLANTLFKTGRRSMLNVSEWRLGTQDDDFKCCKSHERTNVNVKLYHHLMGSLPEVYIPAIPLTPARQIKNGLGNIVRTLDFCNGIEEKVGPASQELEPTVTEFLEVFKKEPTHIGVWALVIPEKAKHDPNSSSLLVEWDSVKARWKPDSDADATHFGYVAYWISKGATFCRVLSGGGGWGAKQGLLSLDPQKTYDEIPEARFDFSYGSMEEQQASALGNVAQEGSFVQFFAAHPSRPQSTQEFSNGPATRSSIIFGSVPSTVDDITSAQPFANVPEGKQLYDLRLGQFGFVSESGLFIHHGSRNVNAALAQDASVGPGLGEHFTKIDLPYSYLRMDFAGTAVQRRIDSGPGPIPIRRVAV
ncbi:V-type ATPase, C subunit family protein [Drepanopeziza brunnea f. sp. 'multigermtubi' MB_m1]|uniref:V-type ATPase, C subunit family protein n=2 Tax=Drepanopeziza brunnea f. sp. 'multigermtubi' TaxID=698441 RepID=K1X924_MARBU|nr:V-type ATPase, C subunit family protein [Drepanopeziza brunnea f. sp. 'multigermtubi' MB_m1]EKD17223.1 V-type ATPase, C subunit family protein [Drepanopeziza brunnea f. sp. 'multigermtubi' MB_m1]